MQATRRSFLGGTVALGALFSRASFAERDVDDFVRAVIDLSRDATGHPHVERVALLTDDGAFGTLPLSPDEIADLQGTLAARTFTDWQQRGVHVDGRHFVFVGSDEGGAVVHAVRRGEFLTLRVTDDAVVLATSGPDMAHGRAVEAVYQFCKRPAGRPAMV